MDDFYRLHTFGRMVALVKKGGDTTTRTEIETTHVSVVSWHRQAIGRSIHLVGGGDGGDGGAANYVRERGAANYMLRERDAPCTAWAVQF